MGSKSYPPFVGVDGEGGNVNGRHQYLHLRAGNRVLETGEDLTTLECLEFLSTLPTGNRLYVAYFFTYDVTMILRDLPTHLMRSLINREGRTMDGRVRWVRYERYLIDWIPGKNFSVAKLTKGEKLRRVLISDVGSFFQCGFATALARWGVAPILRARIAATKQKRASFEAITPLVRLYCKKECDALVELMTEFRQVAASIGPLPVRWEGPGNLAVAWMHTKGVPQDRNVPEECMEFAKDAYYGGRFEVTAIGPVRRKVYQYDINSAYPAVIETLPCLKHGAWSYSTGRRPRSRIYVADVEFHHPQGAFLGAFPVRSQKGTIAYPRTGSGVYWSCEIEAAIRAGCKVKVRAAWSYSVQCDCRPFEWVREIYQLRRSLGKTNRGNALKLAMNSLYGKSAQSIGRPKWANPIWAGLITAGTRALITDACSSVPSEHILMIATDGIFSDAPLSLPLSTELGDWELTEHESMFIIQPGLYLLPGTNPKTRGVPQAKIVEHARALRKEWSQQGDMTHVVPLNRFLAARQALHYGRWTDAGTWYTEERVITYQWDTKRHPTLGYWEPELHPGEVPAYRPSLQDGGVRSVPYSKDIGMWRTIRAFHEDQPEEAEGLFTTDWEDE